MCALIDARDSFDPRSAEAAGVELQRLLWVRCHSLEQSLRAADLLIQGGGFGFIALDLSDVAPETVRHVPLNAWFRFRRAVEDTATVLLVLEQESNAKTCASLVLRMSGKGAKWSSVAAYENSAYENVASKNATRGNLAPGNLTHGRLSLAPAHAQVCLPHARLLDGSDVQVEMLHTRIQSINYQQAQNEFPRAQNGPGSIERNFARRDFAIHSDVAGRGDSQSFAAQTIWSYLHALPVEAKLK